MPQHLLMAAPTGIDRLDVDVGGKVIYLGSKIDKPRVAPGQLIRISHYWKVVEPVGASFTVFGLVRGPVGTADFMNLPATDMQVAHGPATWRAGEIIEDVQEFTLRPDWRSPSATLLVGLIANGEHGLGDRMAATGPHTQDRAVISRQIEVDLARAPPPPGTVNVPHTQGAVTIDGVANDPGWIGAAQSPEFATAEGGTDPVGKATAKMAWDEQYLYLFITVTDTDIFSEYKKHDDTLWKQDCVELFIDADSNRRGYVELQVNPNNVTFDSWFATTRAQPGDPSWDSGMVTAVKVRGTADQAGDTDQGWDVEIAIPWAAVKGRDDGMKVSLPPNVGERWRLNVVRVDNGKAPSSWNRITIGDFHALDRMLTVVFADTTGVITPGTPPVPPPLPVDRGSGAAPGEESGSGVGSASASGPGSSVKPAASSGRSALPDSAAGPGRGAAGSIGPGSVGSAGRAGSGAEPGAGDQRPDPGNARLLFTPAVRAGSAAGSAAAVPPAAAGRGRP